MHSLSQNKGKNMVIPTVDKIQHPFMVKTLNKIGREENILSDKVYLQPERNTRTQNYSSYYTYNFPHEVRNKTRRTTIYQSIQHYIDVASQCVTKE